jgi:hypothetical protein
MEKWVFAPSSPTRKVAPPSGVEVRSGLKASSALAGETPNTSNAKTTIDAAVFLNGSP